MDYTIKYMGNPPKPFGGWGGGENCLTPWIYQMVLDAQIYAC